MQSPNVTTAAALLASTIEQLTNSLNSEVDGLYSNRNEELAARYSEKARLLADYAAGLNGLKTATQNGAIDLPAPMNALLKTRSEALARAMERNIQSLTIAEKASQTVVDAIIEAVKQQRRKGAAYGVGRDGNMAVPNTDPSLTQAVTVDTRL